MLENFFSLSLLKVVNVVLPIVIFPILIQNLGEDLFGVVSVGTAFISYFRVLIFYGFNLTGTKNIAQSSNHRAHSYISTNILATQILLFCVSMLLASIVVLSVPDLREYGEFYLILVFGTLGDALFSTWFYQGIEKMKFIALISFVGKGAALIAVIFLIKDPNDLSLYAIISSTSNILIGLISIVVMRVTFKVQFSVPRRKAVAANLVDGWYLFLSAMSNVLYGNSNIFILSFYVTKAQVGYFTVASQVLLAANAFLLLISQVFYPRLAASFKSSLRDYRKIFFNLIKITAICSTGGGLILFFMRSYLVRLVFGDFNSVIDTLVGWMSITLAFNFLGGIFTKHFVILGRNRLVAIVLVLTAITNFIFFFTLVPTYGVMGMVYTYILVIFTHIVYQYVFYKRLNTFG